MARETAKGRNRKRHKGSPLAGVPESETEARKDRGGRAARVLQAAAMVIEVGSYAEVAAHFGISPPTLYQWMREPEAAKMLRDHANTVRESATLRVTHEIHAAISELVALSKKADKTDGPRVKSIELLCRVAGVLGADGMTEAPPTEAEMLPDDQLQEAIVKRAAELG